MERQHFEDELRALKQRLLHMGGLVEERLHEAVRCLVERRADRVASIVAADAEVDTLQIEIDDRCLKLLALQHPFAKDLRFITAAMKINAELERIGDQAVNIVQCVARLAEMPPLEAAIDLPHMAGLAQGMIRDSLDAFVRRDVALARAVLTRDDQVDDLKDQVFRVLLTHMLADPGTIERALGLILVSRNLERVADHATNVAEDVIFLVEAKDVRHHHEEVQS